jgi:hypothetical protein
VTSPEYVGELYEYCAEPVALVRLVQWEALSFTPADVPDYERRSARYAAKAASLAQAQSDLRLDADLDPKRVLLFLIGLAEWTLYVPQVAGLILGEDPSTPDERRAHREFLEEIAPRVLTPRRT